MGGGGGGGEKDRGRAEPVSSTNEEDPECKRIHGRGTMEGLDFKVKNTSTHIQGIPSVKQILILGRGKP